MTDHDLFTCMLRTDYLNFANGPALDAVYETHLKPEHPWFPVPKRIVSSIQFPLTDMAGLGGSTGPHLKAIIHRTEFQRKLQQFPGRFPSRKKVPVHWNGFTRSAFIIQGGLYFIERPELLLIDQESVGTRQIFVVVALTPMAKTEKAHG